jgi:hypothetical protein
LRERDAYTVTWVCFFFLSFFLAASMSPIILHFLLDVHI